MPCLRFAPRNRATHRRSGRLVGLGLGLLALSIMLTSQVSATALTTAKAATRSAAHAFATSSVPPAGAGSACVPGPQLVPTCGTLFGAAPNIETSTGTQNATKDVEVAGFESLVGRSLDVVHGYHTNDDKFPNPYEVAVATEAGHSRILLLNWRPAMDMTWAAAAAGGADARIDAEAARLKAFGHPIMIAVWHEPEHFVNTTPGSGMSPPDYRAMVRHVILRLRAQGATNAVFVQIYQGFPAYAVQTWWTQMYPGDDVIDWIASDSYNSGNPTGYNSGDFASLVNRVKDTWSGWYQWATTAHPDKPLMLAEWGIWYRSATPSRMAWFYGSVQNELAQYPAIKALNYYNAIAGYSQGTTRVDATLSSLAAYQALATSVTPVNLSGL